MGNSVFFCTWHQRLPYELYGVVKRDQKCDEHLVVVDDENDGDDESPKPILLWETEWKFIKKAFSWITSFTYASRIRRHRHRRK